MALKESIIDQLTLNPKGLDIIDLARELGLEWNDDQLQEAIARLKHDKIITDLGKTNKTREPDGSPTIAPIFKLKPEPLQKIKVLVFKALQQNPDGLTIRELYEITQIKRPWGIERAVCALEGEYKIVFEMRSRNGGAIYEIVKPTNEEKLNALKQAVLKQLAKKDLSDADLLNELRQLKKLKKIIGQFDIYSIVVALGSLQKDGLVYWQIAEGGGAVWHLRSNNIKP